MTSDIDRNAIDMNRAERNIAYLFKKLVLLYTGGEASTISEMEATQLAESLSYLLELDNRSVALVELSTADAEALFQKKMGQLNMKVERVLETWKLVCITMPTIRNVSLRDTLASIGELKRRYDTYFAAHEVPCDIDYQLSKPIDDLELKGVDYVQAWLDQLLKETEWIAQFTTESCIEVLEGCCPDYRGLHVNLYDLLKPREAQLVRKS